MHRLTLALTAFIALMLAACGTTSQVKMFQYEASSSGFDDAKARAETATPPQVAQIYFLLDTAHAQRHPVSFVQSGGLRSDTTDHQLLRVQRAVCLAASQPTDCDYEPYIDGVFGLRWDDDPILIDYEASEQGVLTALEDRDQRRVQFINLYLDGERRGWRGAPRYYLWKRADQVLASADYICFRDNSRTCESRRNIRRLAIFDRSHTQTADGIADRDDGFIDLGGPGDDLQAAISAGQARAEAEDGLLFVEVVSARPSDWGEVAELISQTSRSSEEVCGIFDFRADPRRQREACIAFADVLQIRVVRATPGEDGLFGDWDAFGSALIMGGGG